MRRRSLLVLALATLVVSLPACRYLGPGTDPSDDGRIKHLGGDALLLRYEQVGGFVPAEYNLTRVPIFSLFGDGRVIVTGAVPAIYPGPILPPLLERRVGEDGIQRILRAALDSGALDQSADWRGAASHVADASDAVFTLNIEGRSVRVSVYALGIGGGETFGLSKEERAVHEALDELANVLAAPDTWLPEGAWVDEWHDYRAEALRLVLRNADSDAEVQDGIGIRLVPWPVAGDPARFGAPTAMDGWSCGVVEGAEVGTWYAALEAGDQLTRWTGGGHRYAIAPRPLLPDEVAGCEIEA
jgi:hypothetical protein